MKELKGDVYNASITQDRGGICSEKKAKQLLVHHLGPTPRAPNQDNVGHFFAATLSKGVFFYISWYIYRML